MSIKIIMLVLMYPVVFILYFVLKNEAVSAKNLSYGVSLTGEQCQAPEVQGIHAAYKRQMLHIFLFMFLIQVPALFIPWISVYITFELVWTFANVIAFCLPFAQANRKLKLLKQEKGWKKAEEGQLTAEIKSAGKIRKVKFSQFAPPCILSLVILIGALIKFYGERLWALSICIGSLAFITPLFYAIAVWMDRMSTLVISTDSEVNVNYARAKKKLWRDFWLANAWINTLYTAAMLFTMGWQGGIGGLFLPATAAYLVAVTALLFWIVNKKRKLDISYKDYMDAPILDNDDNWIWGMLYYNPRDKHIMVEKRCGVGTTVNMARPVGKAMIGLTVLALLLSLYACGWTVLLEFTPINLSVGNGYLQASQMKEDYSIPLEAMENLMMLEELPHLSKVNGTGMDNLLKGTFRIPEEGRCEVFLNPQNTLFIRFEYAGETYYMSGYDDEETMRVWEACVEE
ncbi:MAG: hypothetical protein J1E83_09125 [Lachnospiraceae bacterium]|nr:hypothetical protein [Lachnospiraceae bacterium]